MAAVKTWLWEGLVLSSRAALSWVLCLNIGVHYGAIWLCARSTLSCWTQTSTQCWNALHRKAVGNVSTWYSRDELTHRRSREEQVWVKQLSFEFAPCKAEQHQTHNGINYITNIYPELYYLLVKSSIFKVFWQPRYTRFLQFQFTFSKNERMQPALSQACTI